MKVERLKGRVQQVVHNKDGFYIFRILPAEAVSSSSLITAKGSLYGLTQVCSGVPIELTGFWKKHPKYGVQFNVRSWSPWVECDNDVVDFLHLCVEGFHTNRGLARILSKLGSSAYEKLSEGYEPTKEALGLQGDVEPLRKGVLGWQKAVSVRDLSALLRGGGLGAVEIQMAMARFGTGAPILIRENPYRLMEVIPDFPKVDKLATRMGLSVDSPHRMEGAILWAVREDSRQGNLFVPRGSIRDSLDRLVKRNTLLSLPEVSLDNAVDKLVEHKALVLEPGTGVYLPSLYDFERKSAELLGQFMAPAEINVNLKPFLEEYEKSNRIQLSGSQRKAVEILGEHRVLALTGLPGTGKTTAVRALVKLFEEARITYALMAPTGIAAKRLAAVTGRGASTIHRALGYDGECWRSNEDNRYIVDAVIVDEMSMVDQELFYRLLVSLRPETILVFVGDDAQLPSVGPGNVLRELVSSKIPNVRLTQIFRQSEKGEIVINSHRINRGSMPILSGVRGKSEFEFVRISDEDRIVGLIVSMAAKLKSRDSNFQVLSPKYDGAVGVNNLNEMLRDRLNPPGPKEWKRGSLHFRFGDRLMVTQNDYKRCVYNGDMGKLVGISRDELTVKIHGVGPRDPDMLVKFPFEEASEKLKLAYAISVHKSQGSEFDTVILPIVRSQGGMLQRNLLYTAVTRARKKVWLLGEEDAIRKAVSNNLVIKRNTVLSDAIGVQVGHAQ